MIFAVAPHSSNLDFLLTVGVIMALGLKASFLAKKSLFRFPLNIVVGGFGGIAVDRSKPGGVVEDMTRAFKATPNLILGIAPEGTRAHVRQWRSGFALISYAAQVPVLPVVIDYSTKTITFKSLIEQLDDSDAILQSMKDAAQSGVGRS